MVAVTEYPRIIREILTYYAQFKSSVGDISTEVIFDDAQGHYELLHNGWVNGYRVHGALIHVDIIDGKFWIQHDGTETGVANDLEKQGIPKDRIVLAFHSPTMRKYTEYAVS